MTKNQYEYFSAPFRKHGEWLRILKILNKALTLCGYISYPVLLLLLLAERNGLLIRMILVPGISFVLVSGFRYIFNARRPYEVLDIEPLIYKGTEGKSFPSRHVFSIFVIGVCWFFFFPPVGIMLFIGGIMMGMIRVIGGIHFPKDVIAGAFIGIFSGLIGFLLCLSVICVMPAQTVLAEEAGISSESGETTDTGDQTDVTDQTDVGDQTDVTDQMDTGDQTDVTDDPTEPEQPEEVTITFSRKTDELKAGKTFLFKTKVTGTDETVSYSVSNEKYATISKSGRLKGIRVGTVKVTATVCGVSVTKKVKITPKKIVCLDPGHSSKVTAGTEPNGPGSSVRKAKDTYGCAGIVTRVPEYKVTLTLAKKLKKLLVDRGYKVVMTRTDSEHALSCVQRAKIANKAGADIFVRIHINSYHLTYLTGANAYCTSVSNRYVSKSVSKKSKKLSQLVLDNMCSCAGTKNCGVRESDTLTGNNWATMPTTLVEVGFMSNATEDRKLQKESYQNKLVKGMASGIDEYFGF